MKAISYWKDGEQRGYRLIEDDDARLGSIAIQALNAGYSIQAKDIDTDVLLASLDIAAVAWQIACQMEEDLAEPDGVELVPEDFELEPEDFNSEDADVEPAEAATE